MCAIKHKTIAYISRLLKFLYFSKKLKKKFVLVYIKMVELTRKEYNIITKNRGIIETQNISTKELIDFHNR